MKQLRWWLCLVLFPSITITAVAQPRRDAIVIFKDGFHVKGVVHESVRQIIWDRTSGQSFPIFSGNFFLADHVREILFSPGQVNKVFQPTDVKPPMKIVRFDKYYQPLPIQATWQFTGVGEWDETGERKVQFFRAPKGAGEMTQRIAVLTPQYMIGVTTDYQWNLMYFTQEFKPELVRKIILQVFSERKKDLGTLSEAEKYLQIAAFMHEAGWFKEAEKELAQIIDSFPAEKKIAEEMLVKVKRDRADLFVESLEQASKVGQHQVVIAGLEVCDREGYAKIVSPAHRLVAQDLRGSYDKAKSEIDEMRGFLKTMLPLTKYPKVWTKACAFIAEELNHDTANRLDAFLEAAKQYDLERKNKREFSLSAEKVLAMAVSGWLQESKSALPDAEEALKLAQAREFVLEYLKTDSQARRAALLSEFKRGNYLPIDVMARLLAMIPPPCAHESAKINTDVQTMTIEAPDTNGGSYLVQLPPDYHHLRTYPVLVVLHSGRDKADRMHELFAEEAAKAGFILVTPHWAPGKALVRARYQYSKTDHDLVIDTLRDLRRRFQVDSDRVFMTGWEDGANMAFDVALGHPDLFAGVAPMNGSLQPFARKFYWPNAQYLPFYIIGGERDGNSKQMRELMKDWTRDPYSCLYVEYKGRTFEWYGLEVPKMISWMSRKKRFNPIKEMGRPGNGSGLGEEFHSSRGFDNRFYWLRAEALAPSTQDDHLSKTWSFKYRPATFQANLSVGNKSKNDEALIWNQLNVRATGLKNISFWITPGMMDLKHPLAVHLDGQRVGGLRKIQPSLETMLEELYQTGDRQRLYVAKVDIK